VQRAPRQAKGVLIDDVTRSLGRYVPEPDSGFSRSGIPRYIATM